MTSHELANRLLDLPNLPVTRMQWDAGTDQFREIQTVHEKDAEDEDGEGSRFGRAHIHLS